VRLKFKTGTIQYHCQKGRAAIALPFLVISPTRLEMSVAQNPCDTIIPGSPAVLSAIYLQWHGPIRLETG